MQKKEIIWRHILYQARRERLTTFTQKDIAAHFKISTSTVFNALKGPRKLGALEVTGRFFRLIDAEKLLLFWATHRNLTKDILYKAHAPWPVQKMEGEMPPDVIFGAFSAYRLSYGETPADYDQVYVYSNQIPEIQRRFPFQKGRPNLFVLEPDPSLASFGSVTPDEQTFVDLWNLSEWYAKDFLNALKIRLFL